MFERFTNRAQEVIGEAKKAAAQLEQNYIGTEHLLLGLVRVSDSVASKLLHCLLYTSSSYISRICRKITNLIIKRIWIQLIYIIIDLIHLLP